MESVSEKAIKKTDLQTILNAIEIQKTTAEWKKDSGQYIPYPATWLNAECWNDEVQSVVGVVHQNVASKKAGLEAIAKQLGVES